MAATSKIIRVISCKASHTNWRNVLGGFGGIELDPKVSLLCSESTCDPLSPKIIKNTLVIKTLHLHV